MPLKALGAFCICQVSVHTGSRMLTALENGTLLLMASIRLVLRPHGEPDCGRCLSNFEDNSMKLHAQYTHLSIPSQGEAQTISPLQRVPTPPPKHLLVLCKHECSPSLPSLLPSAYSPTIFSFPESNVTQVPFSLDRLSKSHFPVDQTQSFLLR